MKLEQILPQIRKGRGFKRPHWVNYLYLKEEGKARIETVNIWATDYLLEPKKSKKAKKLVKKPISSEKNTHVENEYVFGESEFRERMVERRIETSAGQDSLK